MPSPQAIDASLTEINTCFEELKRFKCFFENLSGSATRISLSNFLHQTGSLRLRERLEEVIDEKLPRVYSLIFGTPDDSQSFLGAYATKVNMSVVKKLKWRLVNFYFVNYIYNFIHIQTFDSGVVLKKKIQKTCMKTVKLSFGHIFLFNFRKTTNNKLLENVKRDTKIYIVEYSPYL